MFNKKRADTAPRKNYIIGVAGLSQGVGATHIGMIIAGFIRAYYGRKTLYAEVAKNKTLYHLFDTTNTKQSVERHGIQYMLGADRKDMVHIRNYGYEYCVVDFGNELQLVKEELMQCDIKIVVGASAMWQRDMWQKACKLVDEVKDCSTFYFISNLGRIPDRIKQDLAPMKIRHMPYEPDLGHISEDTVRLLRRIFDIGRL